MIEKCVNWLSDNRRSLRSIAFDVVRIIVLLIAVWRSKNFLVNIVVVTAWLEGVIRAVSAFVVQPEDLLQIPKWRIRFGIACDVTLCGLLAGWGWMVTSGVLGAGAIMETARYIKAHRDFEETDAKWLEIHNAIPLPSDDSEDDRNT